MKEISSKMLSRCKKIESLTVITQGRLWIAASKGYSDIVKFLIDIDNSQIDRADSRGVTPLLIASFNGHKGVVKILLEKGANFERKNDDGVNPLHAASENGHKSVVKLILKSGANIEAVT